MVAWGPWCVEESESKNSSGIVTGEDGSRISISLLGGEGGIESNALDVAVAVVVVVFLITGVRDIEDGRDFLICRTGKSGMSVIKVSCSRSSNMSRSSWMLADIGGGDGDGLPVVLGLSGRSRSPS